MGAPKLDRNLYEQIVTSRFVFGKSIEQISKEIGKGHSSIQNVVYGFESVRDEDWQRAENMIVKASVPMGLFEWAAEKLGKTLPGSLETAYENNRKGKNAQRTAKATEETAPPVPAADHWDEEKLLLQTLIKEQKQTNELLEQLFDVVFPKWSGDVKDNVNVNCDLMNQTLKRLEDKLEAIKVNVRKRGL